MDIAVPYFVRSCCLSWSSSSTLWDKPLPQTYASHVFSGVPTNVHRPTISTEMLQSLEPMSEWGSQDVNAGLMKGMEQPFFFFFFGQLSKYVRVPVL